MLEQFSALFFPVRSARANLIKALIGKWRGLIDDHFLRLHCQRRRRRRRKALTIITSNSGLSPRGLRFLSDYGHATRRADPAGRCRPPYNVYTAGRQLMIRPNRVESQSSISSRALYAAYFHAAATRRVSQKLYPFSFPRGAQGGKRFLPAACCRASAVGESGSGFPGKRRQLCAGLQPLAARVGRQINQPHFSGSK